MKYLRIIIDKKFKLSKQHKLRDRKCTNLIQTLSKSAKISRGHEALKTIHKGAVLPLLHLDHHFGWKR
jgi:hypothetical protein